MLNYVFYIQFYFLPTLLKSHKAVVCSISMHGVLIFLTSGLHSSWLIGLLIFNTICGVGAGIIVIMSTFHDTIAQCRGGEGGNAKLFTIKVKHGKEIKSKYYKEYKFVTHK